jgi:hypothetical protein
MGAQRCALTFDGGPDPLWTPAALESLAEHRLRATFFVIGSRADLREARKHAHADLEPVGLAWRSDSRRTCSVVGGRKRQQARPHGIRGMLLRHATPRHGYAAPDRR